MENSWTGPGSVLVLVCVGVFICGCGPTGSPGGESVTHSSDADVSEVIIICEEHCKLDAPEKCGKGPCGSAQCIDGCCEFDLEPAETVCTDDNFPCHEGVCDGESLECIDLEDQCKEEDENICTQPTCNGTTGECEEIDVPDGSSPYATSKCWKNGVSCVGGQVTASEDAEKTDLHLGCDKNTAANLFGCIDRFLCSEAGDGSCDPISKLAGAECWLEDEDPEDRICPGASCTAESECVQDDENVYECVGYPEACDVTCQQCTDIVCTWTPSGPNKEHHCDPVDRFGEPCDDGNLCTVGDICGWHPQYDKILAVCNPGEGTTIEDCAAENGWNEVECQLKGISCDPENGCAYDEEKAAEWCKPPSSVCVNESKVYCTHQDPGTGNWDPETGCNIPEPFNDCPELSCGENVCVKIEGDGGDIYLCEFTAYPDGSSCFDGNPCTVGDSCVGGECVPDPEQPQACPDGDGDPCNGPQCIVTDPDSPEGYACEMEPLEIGTPCEADEDTCTAGTCQPGDGSAICVEVLVPTEGLVEVCGDSIDNDCDGMADEICFVLGALPSWLSGMLTTSDGKLQLWLGRVQILPAGEAITPSGSYTLTITPTTAD